MALTIKQDNGTINITFDGATSFDLSTDLGMKEIDLTSVEMVPSAASDIITIRDKGATGVVLVKWKATDDTDARIKYFHKGQRLRTPHIVGNEVSSGVMLILSF